MSMVPTTEGYSGKPQASAEVGQNAGVVFVDLDGTLIETDLLCEALVTLAKKSTGLFLRLLLRLSNGRSVFKRAVSEVIMPDIRQLPFRQDVLDFISEQRTLGRKIILATASDSIWAQRIADELGLFDGILASNGTHNLKGGVKLQAIRSYCQEQGYSEFDYLGDSHADLPIWREARGVYIVAPSKRLLGKVRKFTDPAGMLGIRKSRMSALFSALRPHQWVKNILVFVPAITSHSMLHPPVAIASTIAFACFSICASAAYILNDLADINADRRHPTKRQRPFASGTLPISWGLPMACGLLILGFLLSGLMLPASFSLALGTYFVVTCAYSFFARGVAILDVMTLAGLYTIRVLAGGRATSIAVSEWLKGAMSMAGGDGKKESDDEKKDAAAPSRDETQDGFTLKSHNIFGDFSLRSFLETCLEENDKRLSLYDPRLLRPMLVPSVVRKVVKVLPRRKPSPAASEKKVA